MYLPKFLLLANSGVCFLLGYLTNGAMLWLIVHHTEKEMEPFRPILLLSTIIDFVYLGVYVLAVPAVILARGVSSVLLLGPLGWVPQPFNFALFGLWQLFFGFSRYSIFVPFLYRYCVLCWKKQLKAPHFVGMLSIPLSMSLGFVFLQFSGGYVWTDEQREKMLNLFFKNNDTNSSTRFDNHSSSSGDININDYVICYFMENRTKVQRLGMYALLAILLTYAIVTYCGWCIYRSLKKETVNLSAERARQLNKQITRTLFLQAIPPFVLQFATQLQMSLTLITGIHLGNYSAYQTGIFSWITVVNPVITTMVISAFHKQVAKWLGQPLSWFRPVAAAVDHNSMRNATVTVPPAAAATATAISHKNGTRQREEDEGLTKKIKGRRRRT